MAHRWFKRNVLKEYTFEGRNSGDFKWIIDDPQTMQKMLAATNEEQFESEPFLMANLQWTLDIYPNGETKEHEGNVCLYLRLLEMPSTLQGITASVIFLFGNWTSGYNDKFRYFVTDDETTLTLGMNSDCTRIPLSFWKESGDGSLSVSVSINIFSVKWNKETMRNNLIYQDPIPISSKCTQYPTVLNKTWSVFFRNLSDFRKASVGQRFLSPIYENMWQFVCYPNGRGEDDAGSVALWVTLINPPPFVKSVDCKVKMKIYPSDKSYEFNDEYIHGQEQGYENLFPLSRLNKEPEDLVQGVERCAEFQVIICSRHFEHFEADHADKSVVYDPVQISHILSGQIQQDALPKKYQNMITLQHDAVIQDLSKRMEHRCSTKQIYVYDALHARPPCGAVNIVKKVFWGSPHAFIKL